MTQRDAIIHLVAGGIAGTTGAIATCPLEVVKVRLQSSGGSSTLKVHLPSFASHCSTNTTCKTVNGHRAQYSSYAGHSISGNVSRTLGAQKARFGTFSVRNQVVAFTSLRPGMPLYNTSLSSMNLLQCLRHIIHTEGGRALFKGLGPNIIGVAPSRAIYFWAYSRAKRVLNNTVTPDTAAVHIGSAFSAGFTSSTMTNPIWFIKTRLQLDQKKYGKHMTAFSCARRIYRQGGLFAFYKGISASYFGISETVIYFVIYEHLKAKLLSRNIHSDSDYRSSSDFVEFMLAAATSKAFASTMAYPHEVARTRLREEGSKYKSFFQTLATVFREEGFRAVYRGLGTHLIRQIPNTAIVMGTYEIVVYVCSRYSYRDSTDFYYEEDETEYLDDDDRG